MLHDAPSGSKDRCTVMREIKSTSCDVINFFFSSFFPQVNLPCSTPALMDPLRKGESGHHLVSFKSPQSSCRGF